MDDLISRQAAIDAITVRADRCAENFSTDDPFWEGLVIAKSIIKGLPPVQAATSVQPKRKNGRWKYITLMTVECSKCHKQIHELEYDNFCPSCGADMRGEQDEN